MKFELPNYNKYKPKKGMILLSEPFLTDNYFTRAVILIAEHNDEGTIGFILNKISDIKIKDAIEDFPNLREQLFFGGPVNKESLFFIHTLGDQILDSTEIFPGLYWGGNFSQLQEILTDESIDAEKLRFFVGYAGWGPDQLNKELEENSWIVCKPSLSLTMSKDYKNLWGNFLKKMGPHYSKLINYPIDPNLN